MPSCGSVKKKAVTNRNLEKVNDEIDSVEIDGQFDVEEKIFSEVKPNDEEAQLNTPEEAVAKLIEGNERFAKSKTIGPHRSIDRVYETSSGQSPFAAVICCADSRVPAEIIFDQGVGDIFVIRTAGNSANGDVVMGSIHYAIHIGVKVVVVLGHSSCGGITGAIATHNEDSEEHQMGKVNELLSMLKEDVNEFVGTGKVDEAAKISVERQVQKIMETDYAKEHIENGSIKVVGAFYDIHSGEVDFF